MDLCVFHGYDCIDLGCLCLPWLSWLAAPRILGLSVEGSEEAGYRAQCRVQGSPLPDVQWLGPDELMEGSDISPLSQESLEQHHTTSQLRDVLPGQQYTCSASNPLVLPQAGAGLWGGPSAAAPALPLPGVQGAPAAGDGSLAAAGRRPSLAQMLVQMIHCLHTHIHTNPNVLTSHTFFRLPSINNTLWTYLHVIRSHLIPYQGFICNE